jgi:hypothetical protein
MNWTGGTLARHSRSSARNKVRQQQKQYFAKARQKRLATSARHAASQASPVRLSGLASSTGTTINIPDWFRVCAEPPELAAFGPENVFTVATSRDSEREGSESAEVDVAVSAQKCSQARHYGQNRKRPVDFAAVNERHDEKRRRLLSQIDWAGLTMPRLPELVFRGNPQQSEGQVWSSRPIRQSNKKAHDKKNIHDEATLSSGLASKAQYANFLGSSGTPSIRIQVGSQRSKTNRTHGSCVGTGIDTHQSLACGLSKCPSSGASQMSSDDHSSTREATRALLHNSSQHNHEQRSVGGCLSSTAPLTSRPAPVIWQPVPCRPAEMQQLNWSKTSSQSSTSMAVETGHVSGSTASEVIDSKSWESLVGPYQSMTGRAIGISRGHVHHQPSQPRTHAVRLSIDSIQHPPTLDSSPSLPLLHAAIRSSPCPGPQINPPDSQSALEQQERPESIAIAIGPHELSRQDPGDIRAHRQIEQAEQVLQARHQAASARRRQREDVNEPTMGNPQPGATSSLLKGFAAEAPKITKLESRALKPTAARNARDHVRDDNELWMKFILDGSQDEAKHMAFKSAARDAARSLRPFDSGGSDIATLGMHTSDVNTSISATEGILSSELDAGGMDAVPVLPQPPMSYDSQRSEFILSTTSGSVGPPSEIQLPSEPTYIDFRENSVPILSSTSVVPETLPASAMEEPEATGGPPMATAESSRGPEKGLRFTAPRLFIGRLADTAAQVSVVPQMCKQKDRKGRKSRKAQDGRPDIKKLPNFDGDDIEDFQ